MIGLVTVVTTHFVFSLLALRIRRKSIAISG
uniref:Uncharacterized protein n=1 Tax=Rhizophora mucronata TaxID=61149 RepID=A0A2P2IYX6_RHIMU